jgi:hypothetical protein
VASNSWVCGSELFPTKTFSLVLQRFDVSTKISRFCRTVKRRPIPSPLSLNCAIRWRRSFRPVQTDECIDDSSYQAQQVFAPADARCRSRLTVVLSRQLKLGCIGVVVQGFCRSPPGGRRRSEHRLGWCLSIPRHARDHASEPLHEYDSLICIGRL